MDEKDIAQEDKPDRVKTRYGNARKILSPELFEALQKEFTGHLWVPSATRFCACRHELVLELNAKKIKTKEIARLADLSPRRVRQIIQEDEEKRGIRKPDPAPEESAAPGSAEAVAGPSEGVGVENTLVS